MAQTSTFTGTFTRVGFLIDQVGILLRKLTFVSTDSFDRIIRQGLNRKFIGQLTISAIDGNSLRRAQLTFDFDWTRHEQHLVAGRETIEVDPRWNNGRAPELDAPADTFKAFVDYYKLEVVWQIRYAPGTDIAEARRLLGTSPGTEYKWAGKPEERSYTLSGADEAEVGYGYVYDDALY